MPESSLGLIGSPGSSTRSIPAADVSIECERSAFALAAKGFGAVQEPAREDVQVTGAGTEADERLCEALLAADQEVDVTGLAAGNVGLPQLFVFVRQLRHFEIEDAGDVAGMKVDRARGAGALADDPEYVDANGAGSGLVDQGEVAANKVLGLAQERLLAPIESYVPDTKNSLPGPLASINPLNVEAYLPVRYYGLLKLGDNATVHPDEPVGGEYEAKVSIVDQVFDAASGTFGVRLSLPNPGNQLPAGMRCHVTFSFAEQAPAKFETSSRPGTSRSVNIDPSVHKAD